MQEFHYRINWRARGHIPGHHRSTQAGAGFEFYGHQDLTSGGDARRLDIRASLRDPLQAWKVRLFAQRSAIPVVLIADVSTSMRFQGQHNKWQTLTDFATALAWSAARTGDLFSCVGCDVKVVPELFIPSTLRRSATLELRQRLTQYQSKPGAQGLQHAIDYLPRRRSLVFLASDFQYPLVDAAQIMNSLDGHDVVPVLLQDPAEREAPQGRGLLRVKDLESGAQRLLWLRPALRTRWQEAIAEREMALNDLFRRHGRPALQLNAPFKPDAVTAYFHESF